MLKNAHRIELAITLTALIGVFAYLIHFLLVPALIENESVYLVNAAMLAQPELLKNDWTLTNNSMSFGVAFHYFLQPFYWISADPILVAQSARLVLWLFVISCFIFLGRALKLSFSTIFIALSLYLLVGQGQFAWAWIFGGAEQKVIAYGFLFLSLANLVKKRYVYCGLLAGISFYAHVIVGGWAALAIGLVIISRIKTEPYAIIKYASFALPIAIAVLAYHYFSGLANNDNNYALATMNVYEISAIFRNPHHIDPNYFLSIKKTLLYLLFVSLGVYFSVSNKLPVGTKVLAQIMTIFGLFFGIGILARQLNLYFLLNLYPFRLADALYPLFLSLLVVETVLLSLKQLTIKSPYSNVPTYVFLATVLSMPFFKIALNPQSKTNFAQSSDAAKMHNWIKDNTAKQAIFAVMPCNGDFWLMAERAMIVNFKSASVGKSFPEWYQRLIMLNGMKGFTTVGFNVCRELKEGFNSLSINNLVDISENYGATHYLSDRQHADLNESLLINFGDLYLYEINKIKRVEVL